MVRTKNERCGDFHARVLGKSEVSEFPCGTTAGGEHGVLLPESEQEETEEIDGSLIELEDENEGEEKCNERFANCRQWMAHKTRKNGVRTVLGLLTRTN